MERRLDLDLRVFSDGRRASAAAAAHLLGRAREAVRLRGRFVWVVSGGRTPEPLYRLLARDYRERFPWERTLLYFGDERAVGPRHPESNFRMVRDSLIREVPFLRSHVHRLRGEVRPLSRAADAYEKEIASLVPPGDGSSSAFDLVLLGVGPDGHTASLFPGSSALRERRRSVAAIRRAGQPPFVPRLTLTLPALAASREVLFLASGADKAGVVAQVLGSYPDGSARWPASLVRSDGPIRWFLDRPAAALCATTRLRRRGG